MAHPPELRAGLRHAYVHERLTLDAAAEKLGIGLATARRWKAAAETDGDDWERARAVVRITREGRQVLSEMILDDYITVHRATMERLLNATDMEPLKQAEAVSRLGDALSKATGAAGKLAPAMNVAATQADTLHRLTLFARAKFPHTVEALAEVIPAFGRFLRKDQQK